MAANVLPFIRLEAGVGADYNAGGACPRGSPTGGCAAEGKGEDGGEKDTPVDPKRLTPTYNGNNFMLDLRATKCVELQGLIYCCTT